ncbi:hypothetical protein MFMK1_000905 [Metallumcola ferriviriculae]|uniref:Uncharacterized protein n=1 Tax=Metallumcola ferriviriculae TaxID=3039180 RepID=A0AAU0ULP2_9FIRM|nr:hypothetical protein MFMK1_000905 [Desulfitibacteraceae bacterium MK1]
MPYKLCPHCQGKSYSASNLGRWICPYCRRDISSSREISRSVKWRVIQGNVYLLPWVREEQTGNHEVLVK